VARVWDAVCRHIDGIVIGSTMAALEQHGALAMLAANQRTGFGALRRRLNANAGYLTVAIRLLADQGWLTCAGEPGTDGLAAEPTALGRSVITEFAGGYEGAAQFLPLAARIGEILDGTAPGTAEAELGRFTDLMRREWDLPAPTSRPGSAQARHQVLAHLNGHLLAPLMVALTRRGTLGAGAVIDLDGPGLRQAAGILARQGWAHVTGDQAKLTAAGEVATALAAQYRYPLVYLPLLRRVPGLIFGAGQAAEAAADGAETHLDRELDIGFSGDVFTSVCRAPFLDIALPLFDRQPVAGQPALVVDTGCGDGTMLAALYAAVRQQTERGRQIARHPLLMVGADPSPVARRVAASRLAAAGVPHVIMDGDIADPDRLERALAARGLDARDALHVCKSAIHDRSYRPPAGGEPPADTPPADTPPAGESAGSVSAGTVSAGSVSAGSVSAGSVSAGSEPAGTVPASCSGAYAQPDGTAIPATQMALDLAGFFRRWRPVTGRHGWLVIEAHAVPAATAARLIGRTIATALDATHGYSCQYPVEPEVFAWAARTAGFRSRAHAEPAARALGHTLLTIDHFVAEATQTR
jgi:hypothetical protein